MATLHLMVGLPCSGKTTLAQKLERERSALRLTPDEWQVPLFGQDAEEPRREPFGVAGAQARVRLDQRVLDQVRSGIGVAHHAVRMPEHGFLIAARRCSFTVAHDPISIPQFNKNDAKLRRTSPRDRPLMRQIEFTAPELQLHSHQQTIATGVRILHQSGIA